MNQILLTLLIIAQSSVQPTVKTRSVAERLTVGDRFAVEYVVTCANSAKLAGPLADSLGVFLVVDQRLKTKAHQGYNDNIFTVTFAGFKPGETALPPVRFLVQTGDTIDTLTSDSVRIAIASVLPPTMAAINDIKPAISFPNYWLWLVPAAMALLVLAVYLGSILFKKLQRIKELAAAPLPPWEEAIRALDRLPVQEWLAQGEFQRYYYSLSEILKRYIERRFAFNAVEQTTTEILATMKREKTSLRDEFGSFLTRADMVKYAKFFPPAAEAPLAVEQVRDLVQRTIPAPEPVPAIDAKAEVN